MRAILTALIALAIIAWAILSGAPSINGAMVVDAAPAPAPAQNGHA